VTPDDLPVPVPVGQLALGIFVDAGKLKGTPVTRSSHVRANCAGPQVLVSTRIQPLKIGACQCHGAAVWQ
jgi:hypothetical protein